uniref:Solute carrier family 40 member n=1 Tax=Caenorhabditis tropicalis TaxID=1561998 RepID=A0A1I7TAV3_9PELO
MFACYFRQKTFFAAFGMTLFYKTVMGFDNLAVGYAKSSSDISIFTIGILRSYGSLAGMIGVLSYTVLERKMGLVKTGIVGVVVQQISSLVAVASIWMPGSPLFDESDGYSIQVFLVAIATARYGNY